MINVFVSYLFWTSRLFSLKKRNDKNITKTVANVIYQEVNIAIWLQDPASSLVMCSHYFFMNTYPNQKITKQNEQIPS